MIVRDLDYDIFVHQHHDFCCPFGGERIDRLIELVKLEPGARILDLGCGKAELLIRLAARYRAHGTGVDIAEAYLDVARARARERGVENLLALRHEDVLAFEAPPDLYDLTMSIGMTAFGSAAATLQHLCRWTRPGGLILLGADYSRAGPSDVSGLSELMAIARGQGCKSLYAMAATDEERDHYYGLSMLAVERGAADAGAQGEAFLARFRKSRDAYFQSGRERRGFALLLLQHETRSDAAA